MTSYYQPSCYGCGDKQYQPEDIQELMCKLLEDVRNINEELSDYTNSLSWNLPIFYDDDEHSIQYRLYLENSSKAITPVLPTEEPEYSLSMGTSILALFQKRNTPDSELVSLEEVNDVDQEEKEINLEDILQIQDVILREKLLSINRLIADIKFLNDNPTPDRVLKSSSSFPIPIEPDQGRLTSVVMDNISDDSTNDTLLEAVDLFFVSDNSIPPELLSNDSIPLPENESSNFDHHDDPSFPRPPLEPPDDEVFSNFEPDTGVLTTKVVKGISEHYVLIPKNFPTLYLVFNPLLSFSSENEDKIVQTWIDLKFLKTLVFGILSQFTRAS
nr:hypothetical protein [Tanacetum cinerariifolium]